MHKQPTAGFVALKRILCYIKGTLTAGLHLRSGPLQLIAYSNVDWAGDLTDQRSMTGLCVFLGSNLVSWSSKKQPIVDRSSMEAKYWCLLYDCRIIMAT